MSVWGGEMISDELNGVSKSSTHAPGLIEVWDDLGHCLWNWIILRIIFYEGGWRVKYQVCPDSNIRIENFLEMIMDAFRIPELYQSYKCTN